MPVHDPILDRSIIRLLEKIVRNLKGKAILDVGCGLGRWGFLVRTSLEIDGNKAVLYGLDIWKPYIKSLKKFSLYDYLILTDARYLPFSDSIFYIVLASELVEHMTKDQSFKVIKELERVAKNIIIITTPYGWYPQSIMFDNPYESHKSYWLEKDFEILGYEVYFISGKHYDFYKNRGILSKIISFIRTMFYLIRAETKPNFIIAIKDLKRIKK